MFLLQSMIIREICDKFDPINGLVPLYVIPLRGCPVLWKPLIAITLGLKENDNIICDHIKRLMVYYNLPTKSQTKMNYSETSVITNSVIINL
jgi:hypothetical protein